MTAAGDPDSSAAAGRAAAPVLPPGWCAVVLDSVGSTNDEARALAEAGAPHGTIVWAGRQTAGRGRRNRDWVSPAGNLYCSAVLRPGCTAAVAGQLAFAVALALGEAVLRLAPGLDIRLKWPNDVLVGRRKTAGILLESSVAADGSIDFIIAGTGVNLVSAPSGTAFPATSLTVEGAGGIAPRDLLEAYAEGLDRWLGRWQEDGFVPVRQAWLDRAFGLGEQITMTLDRETLSGRFADLAASGALVLETADGRSRLVTAGDVMIGGGLAASD